MATKVARLVAYLLFRVVLPLSLLIGCMVRYSGLSLIYGLLLLLTPLFRSPTTETIQGSTGQFLKALLGISITTILSQSIFHIVLAVIATDAEPYGFVFGNCTNKEALVRQIGFQRLDHVPAKHIIRLIGPDVLVFLVSVIVLVICSKILKESPKESELPTVTRPRKRRMQKIIECVKIIVVILLLAGCGIIVPSLIGVIYFLSFLITISWWSFGNSLGTRFSIYKFLLLVYTGFHLIILYLYQFPFFQNGLREDTLAARLMGLTALVHTNCSTPWDVEYQSNQVSWPGFINPGILLVLYWHLAFQCRHLICGKTLAKNGSDVKLDAAVTKRHGRRRRQSGTERQVLPQNAADEIIESKSLLAFEVGLVDTGENMHYSSIDHLPSSDNRSKTNDIELLGESDEEIQTDKDSRSHSQSRSNSQPSEKRSALASIFVYIMNQSYVLALIAMMAWSITFHSWMTFVLLLGACIIWMVPKSRRACLLVSPMIVVYAEVLLIIQFIYGLNLTDEELPIVMNGIKMKEIGLIKTKIPCSNLALQTVYTLVFLLTLRQYMRERRLKKEASIQGYALERLDTGSTSITPAFSETLFDYLEQSLSYGEKRSPNDPELADGYDGYTIKQIGRYLWSMLCKYWIFICAGMMLTIAIQDRVAYRLIYLIFFLYFIIVFQLSYTLWRVTMYIFWWVVILYSMCVLCMIYTYQFDKFPAYWKNSTGLSDEILIDLGLQQYNIKDLFVKLLTPTSFLIVIIIQVHYFHQPFMHLSGLERYKREFATSESVDMTAEEGHTTDDTCLTTTDTEAEIIDLKKQWRKEFISWFRQLWRRGSNTWNYVSQYLWRLIEIHIFKVVGFTVIVVAVEEVSAISAVYVIMLALFLALSRCRVLLSHILQFWTGLVLLAKTSFQMSVARVADWERNCTTGPNQSSMQPYPFNETTTNNLWIGLKKVDSAFLPNYLHNYVAILLVIALQSIVRYHQEQNYNHPQRKRPGKGVIFANVRREHADTGMLESLKYLSNYFFYKFGLEICYITTAVTISVRVDANSILYAIFLAGLLLMGRRGNARIWPFYILVLTIMLPLQYMSSLGFPLGLCTEYPWSDKLKSSLQYWLFLPSYTQPPPAYILLADFFQLLFACLQWYVFHLEIGNKREEYGGGINKDILPEVEANLEIPVPDFTTTITSYLDVAKYAVFYYLFWVTMAVVFFAGTNRINIFGLGYVIIVFCFMWFGREFLLKPLRKLLWWWNFLVGYTFLVLFLKASLQLVGCVYLNELKADNCWAVKLFGITCLSSSEDDKDKVCEVKENGLSWDVVCFAFLLLQRRVYSSHYFRHIVAELEAQRRLASRGAELINRILIREVMLQKEREKGILFTIKKKMEELKTKQARLKKNYQEPEEHYQAIRSGDYYLFEDESEDETESPDQVATSLNIGKIDRSSEEKKMGPLQLLSTAIDSGTDTALEKAKEEEQLTERRLSLRRGSNLDTLSKKSFQAEMGSTVESVNDGDIAAPIMKSESESGKCAGVSLESSDSICSKIANTFHLFIAILVSMANWLIKIFNRISRNYRHVARILAEDMRKEKLKIQAEKLGLPFMEGVEPEMHDEGTCAAGGNDNDQVAITIDRPPYAEIKKSLSKTSLDNMEDEDETQFELAQPVFYRLLVAFYYMLISRSELVCYFLIILNQMMSASLLSMPLPIMVFLWGMLSVPRPSKTFWVTVITYTEAVVVIKYLFQFTFFPWNDEESLSLHNSRPFWPPRILGIERQDHYATYDLALLLVLFIHRTILKRYGLWKDAEDITADLVKAEGKELSPPCTPMPVVTEEEDDDMDGFKRLHKINELDAGQESDADGIDSLSKVRTAVFLDAGGSSSRTSTLETGRPRRKTKRSLVAALETSVVSCLTPFQNFYRQMTNSTYNAVVDVYAPMFACDFLAFLIVVFGYWAFGPVQSSGGDVTTYIQENRVPIPFLIMLVVQFMLIIIDRALFLRKYVQGKFIFQVALVIIAHIWLFFILPAVTERRFVINTPAMLWYFVKCIYFALSAYQIRSGYPTRILGNFLTKNYSYLNLFLFKGFLVIPFLLELRALMDWMWTDTTLALSSWLQMEDIYANIFVLKCWRHAETTYPTPRALKRKSTIKYGVGGLLLLLIIFIIWFPLVLFSFANTVYKANPPITCTVTITMGGYQPLFKMTAQQQNIAGIRQDQYFKLQDHYKKKNQALGFVTSYNRDDITIVTINGESTSVWGISPPSQKKLIAELLKDNLFDMELHVSFTRNKTSSQTSEVVAQPFRVRLDYVVSKQMAAIISGNTTKQVNISNLFYPYLRLQNNGRATIITQLLEDEKKPDISLSIHRGNLTNTSGMVEWWQVFEDIPAGMWLPDSTVKKANSSKLTLITFNDRVAPAGFSLITGYGIIGLYVSMVFVIGRFARLFVSEVSFRIMFMELPRIDNILKLCLDIYLVRECCDFRLEEDLFAKLIFLYRSPETMIRWTKQKVE